MTTEYDFQSWVTPTGATASTENADLGGWWDTDAGGGGGVSVPMMTGLTQSFLLGRLVG